MSHRFDKFTERARKVLTLAQEEAQRFNHTYIGPEHILLGLAREPEGVAGRVLANLGIELTAVRQAVESFVERGDGIVIGEIGLTPRAKKAIELAVDEARRMNHHYIGTEHLLIGLVREGDGIAARALASLGVSLEKVRTQVIEVLNSSGQHPRFGYPRSRSQGQESTPYSPGTDIPFAKFSRQARHVLTLAQEEAQRFNHNYIGTEHLLLGLVRERDGVAARVLLRLRVEPNKVRSAVEFIIGRGDSIIMGEIGLTPRAKKVIELTVDEARRLGHTQIGTAHLLLGIVREGEGIAAGVLESLGVSLERVRIAVLAALAAGQEESTVAEETASEHADVIPPLGDWPVDLFEERGREVLDLIGDYFRRIESIPVMATIAPGDLMALLDSPPPDAPVPFETLLADTRDKIIPNLTHWNHPNFYAYFAISGSMPGILAEALTAAFNVNMMVWKSGPAAATLTRVVLRWIADLLGYPADADSVFTNGASLGSFYALCAAREALGLNIREQGLAGRDLPRLRLYISDQTHSSLEKAAIALGIGLDNVVKIRSDARYRMDPAALDAAIAADLAVGYRPLAVCATVGTTSTASVDPIGPISEICRARGIWLHIDAAYGGFWGLVPEVMAAIGDLSVGDSLIVNPHKTLYTQVEISCLYCRRPGALAATFSLIPEYLRTPPGEHVVNYMDYSLQLGHSFRALKIWWVMRSFGISGIRARMADALALTRRLEGGVDSHPDFQRLSTSPFALVCLRAFPADLRAAYPDADEAKQAAILAYVQRLNERILDEVNSSGHAYISHTVLREGYTLRVSIGNIRTETHHVDMLWAMLQEATTRADAVLGQEGARPVLE